MYLRLTIDKKFFQGHFWLGTAIAHAKEDPLKSPV
jgi:hypothetical protein